MVSKLQNAINSFIHITQVEELIKNCNKGEISIQVEFNEDDNCIITFNCKKSQGYSGYRKNYDLSKF